MAEPEQDPREEAKWELINAEQATRLDRQNHALARIETKATVVATFAVAGGQFLATRHPLATDLSTLLGLIAFSCYLLAVACSIWAARVARGADVNAADIVEYAQDPQSSKADVLKQLISSRAAVYEKNNRQNAKRARTWWLSVAFLSAGLVSSVVCIMLTT